LGLFTYLNQGAEEFSSKKSLGDSGSFLLVNDEEQHGLWPAFADVAPGWRVVYGEAGRASCLNYIEANWTDSRPLSLRERLGSGPGVG
jgi:uncharacterized protein YbdZ (MbtH family)